VSGFLFLSEHSSAIGAKKEEIWRQKMSINLVFYFGTVPKSLFFIQISRVFFSF